MPVDPGGGSDNEDAYGRGDAYDVMLAMVMAAVMVMNSRRVR